MKTKITISQTRKAMNHRYYWSKRRRINRFPSTLPSSTIPGTQSSKKTDRAEKGRQTPSLQEIASAYPASRAVTDRAAYSLLSNQSRQFPKASPNRPPKFRRRIFSPGNLMAAPYAWQASYAMRSATKSIRRSCSSFSKATGKTFTRPCE